MREGCWVLDDAAGAEGGVLVRELCAAGGAVLGGWREVGAVGEEWW